MLSNIRAASLMNLLQDDYTGMLKNIKNLDIAATDNEMV